MEEPQVDIKSKDKNPYKITSVILGCLIVLLGSATAWLLADKLNQSNTSTAEETSKDTSTKANTEKILTSIKIAVSKIDMEPNLRWDLIRTDYDKEDHGNGLYYDALGNGVGFYVPGRNLDIQLDGATDLVQNGKMTEDKFKTLAVNYQEKIFNIAETYLTEANFSKTGELKISEDFIVDRFGKFTYYTDESKETICAIGLEEKLEDGDYIGSVACADISNVSETDKALATELVNAFQKKKGEYPSTVNISKARIIDSKYKPYQYMDDAEVNELSGHFYRKSPESNWVFLPLEGFNLCSAYTGDAAKAYAGNYCLKDNGNEGVIKPKS